MKTHYILPAILALITASVSSHAVADGLTYDPYEIYYSKYYGIGEDSSTMKKTDANTTYTEYYNTYYGKSGLSKNDNSASNMSDTADFADPRNYYNW